MESDSDQCDIGIYLNDDCHKKTFKSPKCLFKIGNLKNFNSKLLISRISGIDNIDQKTVCKYHLDMLIIIHP